MLSDVNGQVLWDRDDRVVTLTLDRPEKRNALSPALIHELIRQLDAIDTDASIRAVVLRGNGGHFCAGFDITRIPGAEVPVVPGQPASREAAHGILENLLRHVRDLRVPVVAALSGSVVGAGLDLAINCDLRVGGRSARLGITPARLGIIYEPEGLARFVRVAGLAGAKELFLRGRLIPSERAYQLGLLHAVVEDDQLDAQARSWAAEISENAPLAVEGMKWLFEHVVGNPVRTPEVDRQAQRLIEEAFGSEDRAEAQRAFIEKRPPRFLRH